MKNRIIWSILAIYALFAASKPLLEGTRLFALVPTVSILAPVLFVLLHAPREIGWKRLSVFFAIAFVISWIYESLSIATGFPFGNYHYTEKLGPKLGTVPLLIMPAYFSVCYISWLIARLILDYGRASGRKSGLFAMTLTASFVMVMWDVAMDPSRATVSHAWIWHEGGAYFGVPFKNFVGWFLCVATIFFSYGTVEPRFTSQREAPDRPAYAQTLGLYAALFVEFVSYAVFSPSGTVADPTGQVWNLRDLYQSLGLVSIFTMGFVLLIGVLTLRSSGTA
jgi:putative membrane protein